MERQIIKPVITIDGINVEQFFSFTQTSNYSEFQDTVSLVLGGKNNFVEYVKIGSYVATNIGGEQANFYITDTNDKGHDNGQPITITITGVSNKFADSLNDAKPEKFTNITDNKIIEKMLGGGTFDPPILLKEFNINPNESKLDVAMRAAKQNGFNLYCIGDQLFKKAVTSKGSPVKTYYDDDTDITGFSTNNAVRILGQVNRVIATKHCKKEIQAYGIDGKYENISAKKSVDLSLIFGDGVVKTKNIEMIKAPSQDKAELNRLLETNARKASPREIISFMIKGRELLGVNEVAQIKLTKLKKNVVGVLFEKVYNSKENGEVTTMLSFHPLGRHY